MQTFLPYPDFAQSAKSLDRLRLGKQRLETLQIYRALTLPGYGWKNHPAVRMWEGHEGALLLYGIAICDEWTSRGYKDSVKAKLQAHLPSHTDFSVPKWFGNSGLHRSHRSKLLMKMPEHYSKLWYEIPMPYVWP